MASSRSSASWVSLILLSAVCLLAGALSAALGLIYWQHPARDGVMSFTVQIDAGEDGVTDDRGLASALVQVERAVSRWNLGAPRVRVEDAPARQLGIDLPTRDPARIVDLLETRAELELRWVARKLEIGERPSPAEGTSGGDPPVACQREERSVAAETNPCYLLDGPPILVNADIRSAQPTTGEFGEPCFAIAFTNQAAGRLRESTAANVGRQLAIVFDGEVLSAPVVTGEVGDRAVVCGSLTEQETADLAKSLRAEDLPALTVIDWEETAPGPWLRKLGVGLVASLLAFALCLVATIWVAARGARPAASEPRLTIEA